MNSEHSTLIASHPNHWEVVCHPLRGADPAELLVRAGLPLGLAPLWADGVAQPGFIERVWQGGVHWQAADFDAPLAFVQWLREPFGRLERRLPLLGLLGHGAAVRRVIGAREQHALRTAVGADALAAVFDSQAALQPFGPWSSAAALADAKTYLEHEGCRMLAGIAAAFGAAWREVLRLRTARRLEPVIVQADALARSRAQAMVESLFERVESLERQAPQTGAHANRRS